MANGIQFKTIRIEALYINYQLIKQDALKKNILLVYYKNKVYFK